MTNPSQTLGLIAGNGRFPILFCQKARRSNCKLVVAAVRGDAWWAIRFFADKLCWVGPGELRRMFEYFKSEGVAQVIMAGQVNPNHLFDDRLAFDEEFKQLFAAMKDRKADTIFAAIAGKMRSYGLELMDSTFLIRENLAPKGTLTRRAPTEVELGDISFGFEIAKSMGSIDVGQTVVIKERAIVAVEAMEGTDRAIRRGGLIARNGAVIVKTAKPAQDNRFDVPVIGPKTIRMMKKSGCACLAIEAGKTLIIDREVCVKLADRYGISIIAA